MLNSHPRIWYVTTFCVQMKKIFLYRFVLQRVDLMRIDFEAGVDSLTLASAREKEVCRQCISVFNKYVTLRVDQIMQKELEMDFKMSGLSLALAQAGSELDDILGRVDHK